MQNPIKLLQHLGRHTLSALLPQTCFVCGGAAGNHVLCGVCESGLPLPGLPACPVCALASPEGAICGRCVAQLPRFDATAAALSYEFPVREMVHALKFRARFDLVGYLAGRLDAALLRTDWDVVVPVPITARRLRERGFNQAVLLARPVARRLGVPLHGQRVVKDRDTPQQVGLDQAERRRNLRGAFRALDRFDGARVLVVDDVMTSGATLDEMAAALKAAGAAHVGNLVLARTP